MKCADPNSLRALLKEKQLKMTPQRQRILQVFCEHPDSHLSAEDVYQIVRDDASDIGLATVYRTLELLSELDLLSQINFGDGRSRYASLNLTMPLFTAIGTTGKPTSL